MTLASLTNSGKPPLVYDAGSRTPVFMVMYPAASMSATVVVKSASPVAIGDKSTAAKKDDAVVKFARKNYRWLLPVAALVVVIICMCVAYVSPPS